MPHTPTAEAAGKTPTAKELVQGGHVTHMNESCHTYEWVTSQIRSIYDTHVNEACHTCE